MKTLVAAGKIAFRHEDNMLNCYYMDGDDDKDPIHLGGIHMAAVQNETRRKAFIDLMCGVVEEALDDESGAVVWHAPLAGKTPEGNA
jgi:hypothetical protein